MVSTSTEIYPSTSKQENRPCSALALSSLLLPSFPQTLKNRHYSLLASPAHICGPRHLSAAGLDGRQDVPGTGACFAFDPLSVFNNQR